VNSLRDSLDLIRMVRPQSGTTALEHEIAAERASSLGAAEQRVVKAIAELDADGSDHESRLHHAQQVVWAYFVQRELLGFKRHGDVIQELKIPPQVLASLGTMAAPQR
jgi:hypothetical protein